MVLQSNNQKETFTQAAQLITFKYALIQVESTAKSNPEYLEKSLKLKVKVLSQKSKGITTQQNHSLTSIVLWLQLKPAYVKPSMSSLRYKKREKDGFLHSKDLKAISRNA